MMNTYTYLQIAEKYEVSITVARSAIKKYKIQPIGQILIAKIFDCKEIDSLFSKEFFLDRKTKEGLITISEIMLEQSFSRVEILKRAKLSNTIPLRQRGSTLFTLEMYAKLLDNKFHFKTLHNYSKAYGTEISKLKSLAADNKLGKPIEFHKGIYYDPLIVIAKIQEIEESKRNNEAKGRRFQKYSIRMLKNKKANYNEIIEDGLSYFNESLVESKTYAREFLNHRVGNLKIDLRKTGAVTYINTINKLSFTTNNVEFTDITNIALEGIVGNNEFSEGGMKLYLSLFRFVKDTSAKECKYNIDYPATRGHLVKTGNEIYSKDEWVKLYQYVNNINLHIDCAIGDIKYAEAWAFVMLHLFLTWRKMDFLKIPAPDINQLETKNIFEFDKEKFTLTEAQALIEDVKEQCESLKASKNQRKLTFVYPILHLVLSFGIAITIAEMHQNIRGAKNTKILDYKFCKNYSEKIEQAGFFDKFEIQGFVFRSLKANRTLQTYEFEVAASMPGTLAIAINIVGAGRSHKPDATGYTNTTVEYICLSKGDGRTLDELAIALFTIGFFGFLYREMLLIMTSGKSLDMNFDEENKLMILVKNTLSPQEAEKILDYLLCQRERKRPITDRLIKLDKSELKYLLEKIVKHECPSKEEGVQCLNYCEFPTIRECRGCENAVLTIPTIFQIKNDIIDIILKIEKTPSERVNELRKYSHELLRFLELATEFRIQFGIFGDEFIDHFLDWETIKSKTMELYKSGKLLGEDE